MRRLAVFLTAAALGLAACLTGLPAGADPLLPRLPPPIGPGPSPSPSPTPTPAPKPAPRPAPAPPPTAAPVDRWALLIGVTNYRGNVKDTVGGAADARVVRDVLLRSGWRSDRIRILTDDQATGRAISAGISWLQANSSAKTFSMFHYSGHVKQANGREYLWPVDNAYIADTEVARVLKANRGTSWTSISACEAGGFNEGLASPKHLFTGSSSVVEKSYEDPRTGLSVWTGILFAEGLRDKGAPDRDGSGRVSVDEAFDWAAPRASTYTRNQAKGQQTPLRRGGSGKLDLSAPRI